MSILAIISIVIAAIILWLIAVYNGLIKLKNRVGEAWSDIDVQLKRRYDLIPNLIETVKGYAAHEKETLQQVIDARSKATAMNIDMANVTPDQMVEFSEAQTGLAGALGKLFALAESYPDLKANQNFAKLQDELTDTENKIQAARRFYNGMVRDFNTKIQIFPNNIIAGSLGFKAREFFELESEEEKKNVKVEF